MDDGLKHKENGLVLTVSTIQLVHSTFVMHRLKRAVMTSQKFRQKRLQEIHTSKVRKP